VILRNESSNLGLGFSPPKAESLQFVQYSAAVCSRAAKPLRYAQCEARHCVAADCAPARWDF
jgi:hypothetical protein